MHFIASFVTATLALAPLHHRSPLPLSVPKRATLKTGYYNIANSLGPLLTLNTNTNVTGNGTVSLPQSQVWAVTELAGNYLIPNNGAGAALQGFGSKFLNEGGHLVEVCRLARWRHYSSSVDLGRGCRAGECGTVVDVYGCGD